MGGVALIVSFLLGRTVRGYLEVLQLVPLLRRAASAFTAYWFYSRGKGVWAVRVHGI